MDHKQLGRFFDEVKVGNKIDILYELIKARNMEGFYVLRLTPHTINVSADPADIISTTLGEELQLSYMKSYGRLERGIRSVDSGIQGLIEKIKIGQRLSIDYSEGFFMRGIVRSEGGNPDIPKHSNDVGYAVRLTSSTVGLSRDPMAKKPEKEILLQDILVCTALGERVFHA